MIILGIDPGIATLGYGVVEKDEKGNEIEVDDTAYKKEALTTEENNSAALYLCSESGSIVRYTTALTATAIYDCVISFSPNGGSFAFESSHHALHPKQP